MDCVTNYLILQAATGKKKGTEGPKVVLGNCLKVY